MGSTAREERQPGSQEASGTSRGQGLLSPPRDPGCRKGRQDSFARSSSNLESEEPRKKKGCWLVVWAEFLVSCCGQTKTEIVSMGVARASMIMVSNQVGISSKTRAQTKSCQKKNFWKAEKLEIRIRELRI